MAVLLEYIILQLSVYCSSACDGSNQGYVVVPHENIQSSETEITLEKNFITQLFPNEFSVYTRLTMLYLMQSEIHTISPSAFNSTQLRHLHLSRNKLTTTPDLMVSSETLKHLHLDMRLNDFSHFPNITMHGTDVRLVFRKKSKLLSDNMSTVCQIGELSWVGSQLRSIPDFSCAS